MTTACKFIARSLRPSFVCNWPQAAVTWYGAKREGKRNVYRFADGSAVTFTAAGLPVEFIG